MSRGEIRLYANRSGEQFAEKVSTELTKLYDKEILASPLKTMDFADGEVKTILMKRNGDDPNDTVTEKDAYLVQSCFDPTSRRSVYDNFFEFLQTVDALKRNGANKITAVLPYHPFCRQDRYKEREPLTARFAVNLMERAGVNNVLTCEMHSDQIGGFYDKARITNLKSKYLLFDHLEKSYPNLLENLAVISPDVGSAKRGQSYAKRFQSRIAQAFKVRPEDQPNAIEELSVKGEIESRNILIPDDMVDTAGTIKELFDYLKEKDTLESLVCCTHSLLNGLAIERLRETGAKLITTDTVPRTEAFKKENPWYEEVSIAPLFAKIIYRLNHNQSLS